MLIFSLFNNPWQFISFLVALLIALTIHEFSHAWTANFFGDPTAKMHGRLTLNPIAHLDPLGTLFLLLAGFGWGKPVPIDPRNFHNPKLDNLTVSLAGPISNFLLALFLGLIYRFFNLPVFLEQLVTLLIFFNLVLMIFNLLPIPPLDGSKILGLFMSEESFYFLQQTGVTLLFIILIVSSFFYPIIPTLMSKAVSFFFTLITGKPIVL